MVDINLFLQEKWLDVLSARDHGSGKHRLNLKDGPIFVGVNRAFGQTWWVLYGSFFENSETKLREIFRLAQEQNISRVVSDFNMSRWQDVKLIEKLGGTTRPFATYLLDLTASEETLWKGLHGKHRNMVRRAQREGLTVRQDLDLDVFQSLLNDTYSRGGASNRFSRDYLDQLVGHLGPALISIAAYHGKTLQAAALIPFDRQRGYYLHGAARVGKGSLPGAANLLHWEIIRNLRERNIAAYDLGGVRPETDDPRLKGIFQFKQRFGGTLETCCFWEKITSPFSHLFHRLMMKGHTFLKRS